MRIFQESRTAIFWLSTKCRPTIDRVSTNYWPIHRSSIDQLSAKCRRKVGEVSVNEKLYRPRHIWNDYRPCLDRVSTDYRPTIDRYIDRVSTEYRPTVDWVSTSISTDISVDITRGKRSVGGNNVDRIEQRRKVNSTIRANEGKNFNWLRRWNTSTEKNLSVTWTQTILIARPMHRYLVMPLLDIQVHHSQKFKPEKATAGYLCFFFFVVTERTLFSSFLN